MPAGRSVPYVVLRRGPSGWVCGRDDLRDAVRAARAVALVGDLDELAAVEHAVACGVLEAHDAIVSWAPLVDAMKRVDGDRVVGPVERESLRRLVPPVVVSSSLVERVLAADDSGAPPEVAGRDREVRPLHALVRLAGERGGLDLAALPVFDGSARLGT